MSANRLFLVCKHCASIDNALLLAERSHNDTQYLAAKMKQADDWFGKHMQCGRGNDNFHLAYHRPQDWDSPEPAEGTVNGGVRMAIAEMQ